MKSLLFYCRAGFEKDLGNEILDKSSALQIYGYPQFKPNQGYIVFHCHQAEQAEILLGKLKFSKLIFARQMFMCSELLDDLDPQDRISTLLNSSDALPLCGDLRVEYSDTSEGRELSKFCRKFSVPLRQALRKQQKLTAKPTDQKPVLHVFFPDGASAYIGYSLSTNNSPQPLGILRLKFPSKAPSRSTLKLDEAFQVFIAKEQQALRLAPGLQAVDLGACPGGWTYQLVARGMFVQAVDNGAMDEGLMETGQVSYFAADGFKYEPKKKNVYWLVCDMIEQPQRVAKLMAQWVAKKWCTEAIFNLKLPMKRRYESLGEAFDIIEQVMCDSSCRYEIQAKHLYHDREEITVHLRLI